ncbi:hypothetical protein N7519_011478 [Penicillium mononematosum]|uniref:uncharacterized protein n=1 Tax=Penicillium mononematosum TaxID=268346 RepID=UPI002546EFF8|nr:uncharacterized protein N7519_011478 [Penicillium mononematosum]KAJ6181017.1 hypothetical protein N7519_011478 [Penicillium mononematosum]
MHSSSENGRNVSSARNVSNSEARRNIAGLAADRAAAVEAAAKEDKEEGKGKKRLPSEHPLILIILFLISFSSSSSPPLRITPSCGSYSRGPTNAGAQRPRSPPETTFRRSLLLHRLDTDSRHRLALSQSHTSLIR